MKAETDIDLEHTFDYNELQKDEQIFMKIWRLSSPLTTLMDIVYTEKSDIESDSVQSVMEFALTCLEVWYRSYLISKIKYQCL